MLHRAALAGLIGTTACLLGCTSSFLRPTSSEEIATSEEEIRVELVADVTHPYGMTYVTVEDVGLVIGLDGTGGDPPPIPQRAKLIAEMKRREIDEPGKVLAGADTAMVLVRGILRPGVQKGDRVDVEVKVPTLGSTTSLRGGKLLPCRLSQLAALDSQIHSGRVLALAAGPVLVDPSAGDDEALATHGRVLSGGVVMEDRPLGLEIDRRFQSIRLSQRLGEAINRRFHTVYQGNKQGVATPKTEEFIELRVHPRYRDNVGRYMQVIRSLAIRESASRQQERLETLRQQLAEPITAQTAALQLEAIGSKAAIEILKSQATSPNIDVRFYAAEALAYLDETAAVDPLEAVIREERGYRVHALAALSAMNDPRAHDALRGLLSARSAETRYGAFRALWAMDATDPLVRGHNMNSQFSLHVVEASGHPMVHLTNSKRPEIVLFGANQRLDLPVTLDAGNQILVNGVSGNEVRVTRFAPDMPRQERVVDASLQSLIRAVVELGGTYPDVVQMLQEAHATGSLSSWLRVDAVPGQTRESNLPAVRPASVEAEEPARQTGITGMLPGLFGDDSN